MADPVDTTRQTIADGGVHAAWAVLGGVALKVVEAFARVFGTRKERAEAEVLEAAPAERAADLALRIAERASNERDDCHTRLDALNEKLLEVEREMRTCDERGERQEKEIAWMSRALHELQRGASERPPA
jgi:hypothetical protein